MSTRRKAGKKSAPAKKAADARARTSAPVKRVTAKASPANGHASKAAASKSGPKSGAKSASRSTSKLARSGHSADSASKSTSKSSSGSAPQPVAAQGRGPAADVAPLAAIPADCTIAQAGELKADLARVLASPDAVTLDLAAVRRIDTAALQVLTSFIRERRAAGRGVECQGASDAFLATADVLGLRALFT